MSRAVHLLAALAGAAAILLGSATTASAVPIPSSGAHADAAASTPGATPPPASNDNPITASAQVTASGLDFAEGQAQATVDGAVQSRSEASGASSSSPSNADATASWITQFAVTGTNPGGAIDVDITLNVDGTLDYFNNNSGAGPGDIAADVGLILTVYDSNGSSTAWSGTARLATVTNNTPAVLTRGGDWADPSRDGDFSTSGCSTASSCTWSVSSAIALPDSLFVNFTDTFAVEVELDTSAFIFSGNEVEATSDFFNTGSVSLGTSTAGVGFVALVPEPALGLLLGLAALVLLSGVRRGNAPAVVLRRQGRATPARSSRKRR
jgi:hypothetical protein